MERLLYALEAEKLLNLEEDYLDAFIISFSNKFNLYSLEILKKLRDNDYLVDLDFNNKSFKAQLRKALRLNAKTLIIIGEDEVNNNQLTIKNTKTEEQKTIDKNDLLENIKKVVGY